MRMRKALALTALAFLLLPALTSAAAKNTGTDPLVAPDVQVRLDDWAQGLALESDPARSYEPWTYYVDEFGAYYFDDDFNRIYPAAAMSPGELGGNLVVPCEVEEGLAASGATGSVTDCGGGGGGGGGGGSSVGCWQFTFALNGYYYPNPFNNYTQVQKADLNLLVLGDDFQFYTATVTSKVYNILGQLVQSKTIGTLSSAPSQVVTSWDGKNNSGVPVASGNYIVKLTATSSICGTKTISGGSTALH